MADLSIAAPATATRDSLQEEGGEFAGEAAGADAAELVEEDELGQGTIEQHVVAEAGPPSGPSERQQIITTAAIGVGVLAAVGAAIIIGKKLWSSQAPKVQKVGSRDLTWAHVDLGSLVWGKSMPLHGWQGRPACGAVCRGEAAAA